MTVEEILEVEITPEDIEQCKKRIIKSIVEESENQ